MKETTKEGRSAIRVYVVEDHMGMRMVLREFIEREAGLAVCGAAETAEEALEALARLEADLALVDVSLPGMSGIDLVEVALERWPHLVFLMYSGHGETGYVKRALAVGARGYVLKGDPYELPEAIRQVMRGERYVSAALSGQARA